MNENKQEQQGRELRVALVIPEKKQIILHQLPSQPARLFAGERMANQSRETSAWAHLAKMGMQHLKPYSPLSASEEVDAYALSWGLDRPVRRPAGLKDGMLSVFHIDRYLDQSKRFDETDVLIVQALARTIEERRHGGVPHIESDQGVSVL